MLVGDLSMRQLWWLRNTLELLFWCASSVHGRVALLALTSILRTKNKLGWSYRFCISKPFTINPWDMESLWIISLAPKKVRCQMGSKWQADSNLSGFQLPSLGGHNLKIKPITILLVLSLACEYVESKGLYTYIEHIIYNSFNLSRRRSIDAQVHWTDKILSCSNNSNKSDGSIRIYTKRQSLKIRTTPYAHTVW